MNSHINSYRHNLINALNSPAMECVYSLAHVLQDAWSTEKSVYFCGNGGSAGNAIHLANDFIYGVGKNYGKGFKVEALSSNPAVLTCLANDIGYDQIYSEQIRVKGKPNDVLIVFSGSGKSPNIIKALEMGNELGLKTCAILGFDGGKAKNIAQLAIHFPVQDMQISEDLQLIVGHMCMQWLCANYPQGK